MADVYNLIDSTGVIVPDTSTIKSSVEADYRSALGDDLDVSSNTAAGMLIAADTKGYSSVAQNNAKLANQINPNEAGGIFLDAICALSGITRDPATRSVVRGVECRGLANFLIPAGTQARIGQTGTIWRAVGAIQLSGAGVGFGDFECETLGPEPCAVGELDTPLAGGLLGWDYVRNPSAAIEGTNVESDASLRAKRRRTLAKQGVALVDAQISDLYALPNVRSLQFRENISATQQVIDGITMKPHSIWACVEGGTDADIAQSLLTNKSNGAGWNGAVTVPVVNGKSGQTYNVQFDRPTVKALQMRVTVSKGTATADPLTAIPQAIVAWATGDSSVSTEFEEAAFRVGESVSPFEASWAINVAQPGFIVRKVEITDFNGVYPPSPQEYVIAVNELASIVSNAIQVVVS